MGDYGGYGDYGGGGDGGYGDYGGGGGTTMSGGGGFMTSSQTMNTGSPSRGGDKKRVDSVFPVTVKQLVVDATSTNDLFILDGCEISKVWLYGRVSKIDIKPVQVTYTIDDGTGAIDCTVWINEQTDNTVAQDQRENIKEDMYVKVHGQVRTFNGKKTVSTFAIRQVEDSNEIIHHYLEVIATHLQVSKGPLNPKLAQNHPQTAATSHNMQDVQFGNNPVASGSNMNQTDDYDGEFTHLQRVVLNAFQEDVHSDHGRNITQVVQMLQSQSISEMDVKKTIIELQDDGHLYSTVDDQHFKTTVGV
mmetsp:Transcript_31616/g.38954  ORF Transcript_31616/g.38954 Transcript_31616/m.38954 type:complete len:304 (-) Transcript_31616:305-1216(-)